MFKYILHRGAILKKETPQQIYLVALVDMMAACAEVGHHMVDLIEVFVLKYFKTKLSISVIPNIVLLQGENSFIESICQTFAPLETFLDIIVHDKMTDLVKRPCIRFVQWVYLRTGKDTGQYGANLLADKLVF